MACSSLHETATDAWRRWNAGDIEAACDAERQVTSGEIALWRAIASFMREGGAALHHLEIAWQHDQAQCRRGQARLDVDIALSICLLDVGAMNEVSAWLDRATDDPAPADPMASFWGGLGELARVILGQGGNADGVAQALREQLAPLARERTPDERLLLAQMLANHAFHTERFEQFEWLSAAVEEPGLFSAASALSRARWLYTIGFARYQIGEHDRAEDSWNRAAALAGDHALEGVGLLTALALVRLQVDLNRADEAARTLSEIRPQWGAGRAAQLIQLQQMRARVLLLQSQPARALATVGEALALADSAHLSLTEKASAHTDWAQCLIAADRGNEALEMLSRFAQEHEGRNAQVFACLAHLLAALVKPGSESVQRLRSGLALGKSIRYTMFFRLLPNVAARVCALALEHDIESNFADEVIRQRALPAPPQVGMRWPWPVRMRMYGGFDIQGTSFDPTRGGKTAQKPLELLRMLGCADTLSLPAETLMDAMWPEAEGDAARKSLEMTILRLRRLLGDPTLVLVRDGRVGLDATRVASDVVLRRRAVERLVALSMTVGTGAAAPEGWIGAMNSVLDAARHELLPGTPPAPWLESQRARVAKETVRAALAAATLAQADPASGHQEVAWLETAFAIEPGSEVLAQALMAAYRRAGLLGDALRVYDRVSDHLARQGLRAGPELTATRRRIEQGT